ncbi:ChbG/HpnK family deacetylase [Candidatus Woesearchaeota archaeon]|nr:ChbG/HpnK family deacetylase [Candidatus Woesearchaeota archaeon]
MKYLIITADDFGYSPVFNKVILDLLEKGYLTNTTVMVNRLTEEQGQQLERLKALRISGDISIGLHLEFRDHKNYEKEIQEQVAAFQKIFHRKPDYLDIHKYPSFKDSFRSVAAECRNLHVPCRNTGPAFLAEGILSTPDKVFFGTVKDFSRIKEWLETLEDGDFHEILFHPGKRDPACRSSLNRQRELDAEHVVMLDSQLQKHDIRKANYLDFKAKKP